MNKMNGFDRRQARNALAATIVGLSVIVSAAQEPEQTQALPFIPSASDTLDRQGFVRVINHSAEAGEVRIDAIDDEGESYGPVTLPIDASEAVHFNSDDLESGNAEKGLSDGVGPGEGNWRLKLSSELDIEVLSYVRTADGFLTSMHDTVPSEGGRHWVAFFNPGSNASQVSRLRLTNLGEAAAEVSIAGFDDRGESPGSEVTTTVPAGASRTFTAAALESGGDGLEGALGDGEGKWRMTVESEQPLVVMSLLSDPMGHLTNVSTVPGREPQGPPDLVVVSSSVSNSGPFAGTAFTLSATVRNDGGAPSPVTTLRYYRSSDATITTSDTAVGTVAVGALSASGTSSESFSLTAPSTPGTYYYGACVDVVAGESDTTNNCSASVMVTVPAVQPPPQRRPDLAPLGLFLASGGTLDGSPGRALTFRSFVRNSGDAEAPATTLRFYRSVRRGIEPNDTLVGSVAVGPLAASGATSSALELSLTAPTAAGTYYYGVCVDAVAGESDTTNNCTLSLTVTVDGPPPDLAVGRASVTEIREDGTFWLLATVSNQGAGGSAAPTVRYKRSTDATITTSDTTVGTDEAPTLIPLAGYPATIKLTAPSTPGTYYYGVCVDPVRGESNTTNNCSVSVRVEVGGPPPDLVVLPPSVSEINETPPLDGTFSLVVTVRNQGGGTAAWTTVRYYRSTDGTITTSDTELHTGPVYGLSPSGTSEATVLLTAPATAGTYYYGACVDEVPRESDTANNCSSAASLVVN